MSLKSASQVCCSLSELQLQMYRAFLNSKLARQVIDFGTAIILEEKDAKVVAGGRIGTWSYWAPNQT